VWFGRVPRINRSKSRERQRQAAQVISAERQNIKGTELHLIVVLPRMQIVTSALLLGPRVPF
jgi:hypothetical protein